MTDRNISNSYHATSQVSAYKISLVALGAFEYHLAIFDFKHQHKSNMTRKTKRAVLKGNCYNLFIGIGAFEQKMLTLGRVSILTT